MPKPRRQVIDGKQECIGCKQWLPLEYFTVHRASSTGRNWRCKQCHKLTTFGGITPSQRSKQWQNDNPERYAQLCLESRQRIIHDTFRLEARREAVNRYYHAHREANTQSHRSWRESNPWVKVSDKCRSLIRYTVRGMLDGGPRFKFLTSLTGTQFQSHLKSLWKPGMSWTNFGKGGWTIGHIKPCSDFKDQLLTNEGLQECFHFSNLQPEWEHENNCKHSKTHLTKAQQELLKTPEIPRV